MEPNYVNYGYSPVFTQLQSSQFTPEQQQFSHYHAHRLQNEDPNQTVPSMSNVKSDIQFKIEQPNQQQHQVYTGQYPNESYPCQIHAPDMNYQNSSNVNLQSSAYIPSMFNPHQLQAMPAWHGNDNNFGYPQVVPQHPPMNYHPQAFMMRPPMGYQMKPTMSTVQTLGPQISPITILQQTKQQDGQLSCSTCQKSFLSSTNLKRHLSTKFHQNKMSKLNLDESIIVERGDHTFDISFMEVHGQQSSTSITDLSEAEVVLIDKIDEELSSIDTSNFGIVKAESVSLSPLPIVSSTQQLGIIEEFRCNICDKTFSKRCYFTQHNKTTHIGHKPFKCTKCGKKYPTREAVESHMVKHDGEKPFKCHLCPKSFNHKTDLKRHSILHTTVKPNVCQQCGKGFVRKDHLQKHLGSHQRKMDKLKKVFTQMKSE